MSLKAGWASSCGWSRDGHTNTKHWAHRIIVLQRDCVTHLTMFCRQLTFFFFQSSCASLQVTRRRQRRKPNKPDCSWTQRQTTTKTTRKLRGRTSTQEACGMERPEEEREVIGRSISDQQANPFSSSANGTTHQTLSFPFKCISSRVKTGLNRFLLPVKLSLVCLRLSEFSKERPCRP